MHLVPGTLDESNYIIHVFNYLSMRITKCVKFVFKLVDMYLLQLNTPYSQYIEMMFLLYFLLLIMMIDTKYKILLY